MKASFHPIGMPNRENQTKNVSKQSMVPMFEQSLDDERNA